MNEKHIIGKDCKECCCQKPIHKDCGGYWHCRVVHDDIEEGWIHNYRCDKCFQKDYTYEFDEYGIEF